MVVSFCVDVFNGLNEGKRLTNYLVTTKPVLVEEPVGPPGGVCFSAALPARSVQCTTVECGTSSSL